MGAQTAFCADCGRAVTAGSQPRLEASMSLHRSFWHCAHGTHTDFETQPETTGNNGPFQLCAA